MTTTLNLTPHPIRVYGNRRNDGINDLDRYLLYAIEPASAPARIVTLELDPDEDGVAVVSYRNQIDGLPPVREGYRYVVSLPVALALVGVRCDLLVPFEEVRNREGTVIGCRRLARPV